MSVRANNLRIALLDGLYFAATATLAAVAVTSIVQAEQPQTVRTADIATDRRLTDDHIDSQLNTDDNMPSGDPEESPQAKREAMMLGMKLVEQRRGYIRIDDVAATSPAWDAGIRPGDRLISIDTLKPRSLAPWVQDIGKILQDTPDGKSVSATVERDGEALALRIRLPVSKAAEVRDARQEERALASMAAGNQQQQPLGQQGAMPMANGSDPGAMGTTGNGSGVGGWGLGGFFDDGTGTSGTAGDDRMANSAVAELMAVNTLSGGATNQSQTNGFQNTQSTQSSGGQVGIAAFQNNGNGVNAVVVVRGLPQGTYHVGIGQGDAITGGVGGTNFGAGTVGDGSFSNGSGNQFGRNRNDAFSGRSRAGASNFEGSSVPNNQRPGSQTPPIQRPGLQGSGSGTTPIQRPGVQQPAVGNPSGSLPIQRPSGGSVPAPAGGATGGGAADGASLANPNAAPILAQQFQQEPQQGVDTQNNNFQSAAPGTNGTNQSGTRDTGLNPGEPPQAGNNFSSGDRNNLGTPGGMSPFVSEIGMLRVGPDGSGRVENQIEGMEVRNLVGMSVTVVSAMSQGGGGFSETTADNAQTVGREMPQNGMSQNGMPQNGQFPQNNRAGNNQSGGQNNPLGTQAGQNGGGQGIVATGMIRLMEGGSAPNLGEARRGLLPGEERPVDQATQQQRNRSQITNPQQDFDPSRSQ